MDTHVNHFGMHFYSGRPAKKSKINSPDFNASQKVFTFFFSESYNLRLKFFFLLGFAFIKNKCSCFINT